jgi:hypothetical protein
MVNWLESPKLAASVLRIKAANQPEPAADVPASQYWFSQPLRCDAILRPMQPSCFCP